MNDQLCSTRRWLPTTSNQEVQATPILLVAERHGLVAKVDALMALCRRLEAALTTADTTRARLLESPLHEALDPANAVTAEAAE